VIVGKYVGLTVGDDDVGLNVGSNVTGRVVGVATGAMLGNFVGADVVGMFEGAVVVGCCVVMAGESVGITVGGDVVGGTSNVTPKLTILSSPSFKSKHSDRFVVGFTALSTSSSSIPNNSPPFPFSSPIQTSLNTYPLGGVGIMI